MFFVCFFWSSGKMTFLVFVEMMIAPEKKLTTCLNSNIGQRVGIYLIHPILLPCRFEWLLSASLELYLFLLMIIIMDFWLLQR